MKKNELIAGVIAATLCLTSACYPSFACTPHTPLNGYDSTVNFTGTDVNKYIGQDIYVNGRPESERDFGYQGFFIEPKPVVGSYKPNKGGYTTYDALAGKYLTVLGAVRHPEAPEGEFFDRGVCYLKLQVKDSKDIIYYEYNSQNPLSVPFFVVGYYEKQKAAYKGLDIVYSDKAVRTFLGPLDMVKGDSISKRLGQAWKCVDVKMMDGRKELMLVVLNALQQRTTAPISTRFYLLKDANNYKKKFGPDLWSQVLLNTVVVGMTREMCQLAMGEPYKMDGKMQMGKKMDNWYYYDGTILSFAGEYLIEIKTATTN